MTGLDCEHVLEVAPDLALGLLTGRERAACLAHLEGCVACGAEVSALAVAADDVLLAGPRSTPPAGFDRRVLDRLSRAGAFSRPDPSVRSQDGVGAGEPFGALPQAGVP